MPTPVTLARCPIGLFTAESGELCLKTEYGNNEGRIDAYIVSTGEFFWGAHPQTIANQRAQIVTPVEVTGLADRSCTCHPDDYPPVPCPQKYALTECRKAAAERAPHEQNAQGEGK